MTTLHPTAVVEPGAQLGTDVTVGPFCHIASGAVIGDGCRLGAHVTVFGCVELGPRCRVHAGAVLGDEPQDYAYGGCESHVRIGGDCILREGITIHRGTKPGTATLIGEGCMLMATSHFAHNVELGPGVIVASGALLGGYVKVGARAFISGNVGLHQFVRVGTLAMLAVGTVVTKDVPPFCMTRPATGNGVNGLNIVGMRRAGIPPPERAAIKAAFKTLYLAGLNVSQALPVLERQAADSASVRAMVDFIRESKRGICGCRIQGRGPVEEPA